MKTSLASTRELAAALKSSAAKTGSTTPSVRGADWRTAVVTAVGAGTVTADGIVVRCMETYMQPLVGDVAVISQSSNGNWIAFGRLATASTNAWTSYTPTWTAGTTNPSLGNGTLIGRFQRVDRTINLQINLVAGSTTTYGSGVFSFALPARAADSGCTYIGNAHILLTTSSTFRYGGQFVISPNATAASPSFPDATLTPATRHTLWNQTVPLTFASTGQMRITATYEAAN